MSKKILDELQSKLGQIMDSSPAKDIERNVRAILTQAVSKLELVTSEEYEVQRLTIVQLQNRVNMLEKRLSDLENRIQQSASTSSSSDKK
ncbi:accessory factor UbiK family protein [Oxalobacter formigenes]|uniref:accessory factor UbiK family protein n=1 Tax=Oxalobacter formigenes TaxID=847 RepID=UPI0022B037FB|nr:accessory factor UbiK family protein [Oxalobacter formigenes]WAW05398.1 accessory factor UbiK family protein [Oxalobacter formigenes]